MKLGAMMADDKLTRTTHVELKSRLISVHRAVDKALEEPLINEGNCCIREFGINLSEFGLPRFHQLSDSQSAAADPLVVG